MSTFIIAEAGSSHDNDLQKAHRLIEAAKECGADAVKFQWTSSGGNMARRRGLDSDAALMYGTLLEKPVSWLESLKAHCDKVGIEFMCTVYLIEDIAVIAPLVKRFKVSAFESKWRAFVKAHLKYDKEVIASSNGDCVAETLGESAQVKTLLCTSEYPCPLEKVKMERLREIDDLTCLPIIDGFSDHTANVLTGAAAVAAGAKIIEAHIRLIDTNGDNPDYDHSLVADCGFPRPSGPIPFNEYVQNIRTVERML